MKRLALLLASVLLLGLASAQRAAAEDPRYSVQCNSIFNSNLSPLLTTSEPTLLPPDGVWFSPQVFRLSGEATFVATIADSQSFGPSHVVSTIVFDSSGSSSEEQPVLLIPTTSTLPNQETITISIDETRNPETSHPDLPVVCTYTVLGDSDNDGIPGQWEQNGVTRNGQFINLPAMGANPNRADIFLQIDWMQNSSINQQLTDAALRQVATAFANAPTSNPDGSTGISMHIDQGQGSTLNFTTNTTWGSLSRAQSIPWQANLGTASGNNYNWTAFQTIKSANFEPTGRAPIFHYVIAGSRQEPGQNSSGISRNGNDFDAGASDLFVSLGGFQKGVGSQQQQAGTLMHELGHNLSLHHGGNEDTNFKPNYLSIMSYSFQMGGLTVGGTTGVIDYSQSALPPLNENALNEATGLGPAAGNLGTAHLCGMSSASPRPIRFVNTANGPIDWNCNNSTTDSVVSFDADGSGGNSTLFGHDDWANIKLRVGAVGSLGDAAQPTTSLSEPLVTTDTTPPTTTAQVVPAPTAFGWNKSAVAVTLTATDADGSVSRLTYRASGAHTIASTTVFGPVASFNLSNEGITTITVSAQDHQGNVEPETQIAVRIDLTPPTVTLGTAFPAPNAAGWNNTNVNVPFTATDTLSGIDTTIPPSSPLVLTAEGAAVTGTVTATDKAGNSTSVNTPAFKIDKTPPVITITSPTAGQVFDSDGTLTPVFSATDTLSGVKSVVGQLDTGQVVTSGVTIPLGLLVGQRTLTVTAIDVADNVAIKEVKFRVRPVFVGVVYNDPNATGARETGEAGIGGVRIFLDNDGDGFLDSDEPSNVTTSAGAYRVVGEDVGSARLCEQAAPAANGLPANRVRTTSRCQTVIVATGIPVPKTDFGSLLRGNSCTAGAMTTVIQSISPVPLASGSPREYWRPTGLFGTATGAWAGTRLITPIGTANPTVQVQPGEYVAHGLFLGGVNATTNPDLVLTFNYQTPYQTVLSVVAADGTVAEPITPSGPDLPNPLPKTFSTFDRNGLLYIFGVPKDPQGVTKNYMDVTVTTQMNAGASYLTTSARIAGKVVDINGQTRLQPISNTCGADTASVGVTGLVGGPRPEALVVDDVPNKGSIINPF